MNAVCGWCLARVKAPSHYQPLLHEIYCSVHCQQKDWLFKKWMSDRWLNYVAKEYKNEASNKGTTGGT